MNAKPISFRIAAICLSILLGGSYLAYRTLGARGSRGGSQDLFPGSKSAPADAALMPGSKSAGVPVWNGDPNLLPGSKSIVPYTFPPTQQSQQPSPTK